MNVWEKLQTARMKLHAMNLKKSGWNDYSKYAYYELGDFLPQTLTLFAELKLIGTVSFGRDDSKLTITNYEKPEEQIVVMSPTGSASLKAAHEIQNIGAVQTYLRRYLWMAAMELVEHDAVDASPGPGAKPTWVAKMKGAQTLEELQQIFGEAYKATDGDERKEVKKQYDELKSAFAT
jgi:hypothetical protein